MLAINGHILGKEDGGGGDRRVEDEERLKRGADAESNHQGGAQCNVDCHNDHNDHHLGDDDCGRKFVGDTHIVGAICSCPVLEKSRRENEGAKLLLLLLCSLAHY